MTGKRQKNIIKCQLNKIGIKFEKYEKVKTALKEIENQKRNKGNI